jgi:hypothetical protein
MLSPICCGCRAVHTDAAIVVDIPTILKQEAFGGAPPDTRHRDACASCEQKGERKRSAFMASTMPSKMSKGCAAETTPMHALESGT